MLLPGKQLCGLCSTEKLVWIFWLHNWYLWSFKNKLKQQDDYNAVRAQWLAAFLVVIHLAPLYTRVQFFRCGVGPHLAEGILKVCEGWGLG